MEMLEANKKMSIEWLRWESSTFHHILLMLIVMFLETLEEEILMVAWKKK